MLNFGAMDGANHFTSSPAGISMQTSPNSFPSANPGVCLQFDSNAVFGAAGDEKSAWAVNQHHASITEPHHASLSSSREPKNYCSHTSAAIEDDQATFAEHKGSENVKRFSVNNLLQLANNCRAEDHRLAGS